MKCVNLIWIHCQVRCTERMAQIKFFLHNEVMCTSPSKASKRMPNLCKFCRFWLKLDIIMHQKDFIIL